jgi:hypothetical protein
MEIFLSPGGSDKNKGDSPKTPRLTLPALTPDPKEILQVWSRPGTRVTKAVDLSGWAKVVMMPYVLSPQHGNGARLIRDWKKGKGVKPYFASVTIRGSGFSLVNVDFGLLDTQDQAGKEGTSPGPGLEPEHERVLVVIKGAKIGKWIADKWEFVQGTLDDVEVDEWDFGKTWVKEIVLTENTDEKGLPKKNLRIKKALRYALKTGAKEEGMRLKLSHLGGELSWSNRLGGME